MPADHSVPSSYTLRDGGVSAFVVLTRIRDYYYSYIRFSGHTTSSLVLIRYSDALFTPQQRETMHDWVVEDTNTDHKATVFSIRLLRRYWSNALKCTDQYIQLRYSDPSDVQVDYPPSAITVSGIRASGLQVPITPFTLFSHCGIDICCINTVAFALLLLVLQNRHERINHRTQGSAWS